MQFVQQIVVYGNQNFSYKTLKNWTERTKYFFVKMYLTATRVL